MISPSNYAHEVPGKLEIPYRYQAGETGSIFLTTLRDQKKIMATRCPKCETVFIPPRSLCSNCYKRISEWKEVGPRGMVVSFTVVRYQEPHLVKPAPYVLALIKLQGADTALTHLLGEVDPREVKIGMQVEAVFAENRQARITDIAYFRPAKAAPKAEKPAKKAELKPAAKAEKAAKPAKKAAAKKPAKKAPGKKAAKKAAKKATKKAVKKATKKAVKKSPKKTAQKAVTKPAPKAAPKAPKKAPKKTAKKVGRPATQKGKAAKKRSR